MGGTRSSGVGKVSRMVGESLEFRAGITEFAAVRARIPPHCSFVCGFVGAAMTLLAVNPPYRAWLKFG